MGGKFISLFYLAVFLKMAKPHARIRDPVLLPLRVWKKFSRVLDNMLLALYQVHNRIQYVREPTI